MRSALPAWSTPARRPYVALRRAALLGALTLGAAQAQSTVSPAQRLFDQVNGLIQNVYGGLSTVDRSALRREYQTRLDNVCRTDGLDCPEARAYPVLTAELQALGDEHSYFMTPEDLSDFETRVTGGNRRQFGVRLAPLDGENRVVTEVVPGSAAEMAGLRRGDLLLKLDGQPYTYAALRTARESGRTIALELTRLGQPLTLSLTATESSTRELPQLRFVPEPSGAGGQIAVLRIPTFLAGGGIGQRVHDLVGQAQSQGARGVVVDLRGNTGGSLIECDTAISAFVPTVTRLARTAGGSSRTVVSRGARVEDGQPGGGLLRPNLWTGPVSVLVDEGSASCSEFFAYEVQYARRGPVLGEPTAGVGNTATRVFDVGKAAIQLTTLNYTKPDGVPYPTRVTPDQAVEEGEAQLRRLTQGQDDLLNAGLQALTSAPTLGADPFRTTP